MISPDRFVGLPLSGMSRLSVGASCGTSTLRGKAPADERGTSTSSQYIHVRAIINGMDPSAILKDIPDILKGTATLAGAVKFSDLVKAMLGPATTEVADRIRDEVRIYRFGRQLKLLDKAEKMAANAGFKPKAVPIKLLFPLLEGASLEEDETLHTAWAALLANASDERAKVQIWPSFIDLMRQLSPLEAELLSTAYDATENKNSSLIDPKRRFLILFHSELPQRPTSSSELPSELSASSQLKGHNKPPALLPRFTSAPQDFAVSKARWEERDNLIELLNSRLAPFDDSVESNRQGGGISRDLEIALDNLLRLRVLLTMMTINEVADRPYKQQSSIGKDAKLFISMTRNDVGCYVVSRLGMEFVRACRAPET